MSDRTVNILGVGNVLMGDDGVGPAAIAALERRGLPAGIFAHDAGLAVSDGLGRLEPSHPLIVIDALRAGGRPGSVYRADIVDLRPTQATPGGQISLHEISVLPALRIEAMIGRAFDDVTVFGVQPAGLQWGAPLSPMVAGIVQTLVQAVLKHAEMKLTSAKAGAETR